MFTTHLTSMEKVSWINPPSSSICNRITPPKTNECSLKRDYFNRKYIFQPLIFKPRLRSILLDTGKQESDGIWGKDNLAPPTFAFGKRVTTETGDEPTMSFLVWAISSTGWAFGAQINFIIFSSIHGHVDRRSMVILFVLYLWMFTARMFLLFFVSFSVAKSLHSLYVSKRCWSGKQTWNNIHSFILPTISESLHKKRQ